MTTQLEPTESLTEPLDLDLLRSLLPPRPVISAEDPTIGNWDGVLEPAPVSAPTSPHVFWTVSTTSHIETLALPGGVLPVALCLVAALLEDDQGREIGSAIHAYLTHGPLDSRHIEQWIARQAELEELGLIELTANTSDALAAQSRDLARTHRAQLSTNLLTQRGGCDQAVISDVAPRRPNPEVFVVDGVDAESPRAPWPVVEWALEDLSVDERSEVWLITPPNIHDPERWVTFIRIHEDTDCRLDGVVRLESFARPDERFDAAVAYCLRMGRGGQLPHQQLAACSFAQLQARLLP